MSKIPAKIIVIGASGYIGRNLLERAKKTTTAYGTNSTGTHGLLRFDLNAPSDFDYDIFQASDTAILTSAISAPDVCAKEYERAWNINVTGISEFINQVLSRNARVIFFSSDTVYGERDEDFDERASVNPVGEYAVMKHEVEKRFLNNPLFKTIRLSYVFSREDKFTKYLSDCAARRENAEIFHPFYRSVIHRDDVTSGVIALAQRWNDFPQPVINFGGPETLARIEFAEILRDDALPELEFSITEPDDNFFINRPRAIRMNSPVLAKLLGRSAHSLSQAAEIEFN